MESGTELKKSSQPSLALTNTGSKPLLLLSPHRTELLVARIIIAISIVTLAMLAPFSRTQLPEMVAFIPIYDTAISMNDFASCLLLLGQFVQHRARSLPVLACGYLFTALLVIPHALTFPRLFSPAGLLHAGPQTTAWIYQFWHLGFPLFVLAFVSLHRREQVSSDVTTSQPSTHEVLRMIAGVIGLVIVLVLASTFGHDLLPAMMNNDQYTGAMHGVVYSSLGLAALALLALLRIPKPSVLILRAV